MKRIILTTIVCTLAIGLCLPRVCASFSEDKDSQKAQETYRAYVMAWKVKDVSALRKLISDDYMAVNFEGKLSNKENEISTAKEDAEWNSMTVDEIHTTIFGGTAIASGFISAQGKRKNGTTLDAKVRFLAALVKRNESWQLVATQSSSFKPQSTP